MSEKPLTYTSISPWILAKFTSQDRSNRHIEPNEFI